MKIRTLYFFRLSMILLLSSGLLSLHANGYAIRLVGQVVDRTTREPIPFASIGVSETYLGTAADIRGSFELILNDLYANNMLNITAVGYKSISVSVSRMQTVSPLVIEMEPENYNLSEVEIKTKSAKAKVVLESVLKAIPLNYINVPYNYELTYEDERSGQGEEEASSKVRKVLVRLYDGVGYKRDDAYAVFNAVKYEVLKAEKNYDPAALADGDMLLDDLLALDLVRVRQNVLDKENFKYYDLKVASEYKSNSGDSLMLVTYKCNQPSLALTGDYYSKGYEGKLYINKKNYAVVKNEISGVLSDISPLGRSFFRKEEELNGKIKTKSVRYVATIAYEKDKKSGRYGLKKIDYWLFKNITDTSNEVRMNTFRVVAEVQKTETEDPIVVKSRTYYENVPPAPASGEK